MLARAVDDATTVVTMRACQVAVSLTRLEMHRTESQHEESYTYKITLFQFVNFYGALFYLAFWRGNFIVSTHSSPKDVKARIACPITGTRRVAPCAQLSDRTAQAVSWTCPSSY